jgi:hypothetical protein
VPTKGHAKSCTPAIEKKRAWQWAKAKPFGKIILVVLLLPTAIFATLDPFFFNRFRSAFVMPFVRHSADFFIWLPLRSADESGWP